MLHITYHNFKKDSYDFPFTIQPKKGVRFKRKKCGHCVPPGLQPAYLDHWDGKDNHLEEHVII